MTTKIEIMEIKIKQLERQIEVLNKKLKTVSEVTDSLIYEINDITIKLEHASFGKRIKFLITGRF